MLPIFLSLGQKDFMGDPEASKQIWLWGCGLLAMAGLILLPLVGRAGWVTEQAGMNRMVFLGIWTASAFCLWRSGGRRSSPAFSRKRCLGAGLLFLWGILGALGALAI